MNIELYEEQVATVYITLEGKADVYKVYGGTSKGQFHTEVGDDDMHWEIYVPAESTAGCSVPRYDIFAKRVSTGQEWRILSGKIATKKRQSQVEGECVSPVEYHVTLPLVEDMVIVDGGQVLIGIKGDKGERGISAYDIAVQNGFEGDEREFTNMMVCVQTYAEQAQKSSTDAYDAQILSEVAAINALQSAQDAKDAADNIEVPELTAESIQAAAPIAWGEFNLYPEATRVKAIAIGDYARSKGNYSISLGSTTLCKDDLSISIGHNSQSTYRYDLACGISAVTNASAAITIGMGYGDTAGSYTCQTQGTGSITIGAGANTLNNGSTESSNSVTIGCKASNTGADSVVIGAQASNTGSGAVLLGGRNVGNGSTVLVGNDINANSYNSVISLGFGNRIGGSLVVAIGRDIQYTKQNAVCVGHYTSAATGSVALGDRATAYGADRTVAIGASAKVSDSGATVIRSTAEDGTYTQLYFSGANTPLANTYHGGAPMLGYVTKDSAGNIVAAGTRSLIDLLTENSTFAPASLDENGEWVMPKVFHPSDLDMPSEEPSEPEEYTPLPVYPIVEPEIEEEIE